MRRSVMTPLFVLILVPFVAEPAAAQDPETRVVSTDDLRECIEASLPAERAKSQPNANRLVSACAAELNELLRKAPKKNRDELRRLLKDEFKKMLRR